MYVHMYNQMLWYLYSVFVVWQPWCTHACCHLPIFLCPSLRLVSLSVAYSGSRLETSSVDILDIDFGGSAAGPPATSASTVTTSGNVDLLAGPNTLPSPLSPITITPSLSSNTSATSVSAQPPKEELGFSADFSIPNHQQPPPKEGRCGQCGCGQCGEMYVVLCVHSFIQPPTVT